jgi:hypothetical protein
VLDRAGVPVWFQALELPDPEGSIGLFNPTDDDGVVVLVANGIQEWDMVGNQRVRLERGVHFDRRIHHDVFKHAGHIYTLWADTIDVGRAEVVLDGVYVFDAAGSIVGEWSLADHVTLEEEDLRGLPPRGFWEDEFPGATDWSHGNSVWTDGDGLYLSMRWINAIYKLKPWGHPDFGAVEWVLTGQQSSPVETDFVLESAVEGPLSFIGQHHATVAPDGLVTLFDNRHPGEASRALGFRVEPTSGIATLEVAHVVPQQCNVQGVLGRLLRGLLRNPL